MSRRPQQPRVVADGWGRQASGSVFCADSSLRYIFESPLEPPPPGTAAAAITSLASGEFDHKASTVSTPSSSTAVHGKSLAYPTSYDKLTTPNNNSWSLMSANMVAAKLDPTSGSSGRGADGVDLFEAQIARACAQITKQTASLPHSFRECSVCLSQNAYAQITVCGHTFHSKCFLRWFRTNRSCPLCRGPVDAVQLAPVLSVQDELEAIMAEMDDDHEPLEVADPLMTNPDLISFLGEGFDDADMDMMALEDLEAVPLAPVDKHHHHHHDHHHHDHDHQQCQPQDQEDEDEDMDMDDDEEEDGDNQVPTPVTAPSMNMPMQQVAPPQFAPTSTMPNYWNVLNQGLSMPSVVPPPIMPAPTHQHMSLQQQHQHHHQQQQQQQSRVVPIAPKPDGQFHAHAHHAHQHIYAHAPQAFAAAPRASSPAASTASTTPAAPRVVSCRCTGGCRNGRCACVKEGGMCGVACRCTSCKNPFLMVKAAGADIDALLQDACFMHNVSKTRDMVQRMQEPVDVPCCGTTLTVLDCVQGYTCTKCDRRFDFSWCMNKLLDHDKTPRNHCEICKRCCDHRDVHCHDCGRCYFAGVAASLPCPCKESSRKRRDHSTNASSGDLVHAASAMKDDAAEGEEKEGECSIM